ncbi:MAG TPA: hypothetical protein VNN17_05845 [Terriglobia bacterium]|nr:hypothetical protein [Terriglobia bacterium]
MSLRGLLLAMMAAAPPFAAAQASASSPQAIQILEQVLSVSGARAMPLQSFTAQGTITYYWAGQPVQGSATVRARGGEEVRLDAQLPDGPRSVVLSRRGGARKGSDGKRTAIPSHNAAGAGLPALPYLFLSSLLADANAQVVYLGEESREGRREHHVQLVRRFSKETDPDGIAAALSRCDIFVDANTLQVLRIEDRIHPVQSALETYPRAIEWEAYTPIGGIAVPTIVREKVGGQTTWELRISTVQFNSDLSDDEFSLPE